MTGESGVRERDERDERGEHEHEDAGPPPDARSSGGVLAVDIGLRAGLAWFDGAGVLVRYRSTHFADRGALRRAVRPVLRERPDTTTLVMEGGGPVADVWQSAAQRLGLAVVRIAAETWRADLLLARERRSGGRAKDTADALARTVVAESGMPRPTSLRHDAAEAICVGRWWFRFGRRRPAPGRR